MASSPTYTSDSIVINAVPISVHLAVIITATVLVGVLYLLAYAQLLMVLCCGFRLISYQTVFLFSILLWASLRLVLYSCYYYACCDFVLYKLSLYVFWSWFLENFPTTLQYFTLALLVHYFAGELLNERRRAASSLPRFYKHSRRCGWSTWLLSVLLHLASNITFGFIIPLSSYQRYLLYLRVLVLDGQMLIMSTAMAVCVALVFRTKGGRPKTQRAGSDLTKCWSLLLSGALVALYLTRAVYKIIRVILSSNHESTTDMADYLFGSHYGYIAYLVELLLWEVLPTYLIVVYFRVEIPCHQFQSVAKPETDVLVNQKYFFDNPQRYDADVPSIQVAVPRLISPSRAGYGSTPQSASFPGRSGVSISTAPMPGTTPPKLFGDSPSIFAT